MKRFNSLFWLILTILPISSCGLFPDNQDDGNEDDPPVVEQHIDVTMDPGLGYDIYQMPTNGGGYRYGPSILVNEHIDGTSRIEAWFATNGFDTQSWDIFSYRYSDNNGANWSDEIIALFPTPGSLDTYSVCDPAVFKYGQYYYIGYTSTYNANQRDNCAYVARSTSPTGPWEKWNGSSWGGSDPQPIVYWDQYGMGDTSYWGSGEPSFVILDDTIYMYYTYEGSGGRVSRVMTGDITSINWPSTLVDRGICLGIGSNDAIDVAYIEEYNKFIALATDSRFSADSYLAFYESDDGLRFTLADVCKENTMWYCHNSGLSKNGLGHITPTMSPFVGYAYGEGWGIWNTRFQNITISLRDEIDLSELSRSNYHGPTNRDSRDPASLNFCGITCFMPNSQSDEYACYENAGSMTISTYVYRPFRDHYTEITTPDAVADLRYSGYDSSVISPVNGSRTINIVGPGTTQLIVSWRGFNTITKFRVVKADGQDANVDKVEPMVKLSTASNYQLDLSSKDNCQPKIKVTYHDGTWEEMAGTGVTYSNYNSNIITLNTTTGNVWAKAVGTSTLTMSVGGKSTTVNIIVADQGMTEMDFTDYNKAPMDKILVKESETNVLKNLNNETVINMQRGHLRLKATTNHDPYIIINNSLGNIDPTRFKKISIEYKIDTTKTGEYPSAFYFASAANGWTAENRKGFNLPISDEYQTVTVDMSNAPGWNENLKYIRFDYFEAGVNAGDVINIRKINFLA